MSNKMISLPTRDLIWQGFKIAEARASAYALLALALRPPTTDILEQLISGEAWQKYLDICPEAGISKKVALLTNAAVIFKNKHDQKDPLLALGVNYNHLFAGPGTVPAPPYGSIYLEGRIMGETTMAALQFYSNTGLAPDETIADLPDHAAIESEFLCEIIWREMRSWEKNDLPAVIKWLEVQISFSKEHFGRWFPLFAARLDSTENTGIYQPLLELGRTLIAFDKQLTFHILEMARDNVHNRSKTGAG